MKIDVVHHLAVDKQTISELLLVLREAELTLAQCQRQFPDSSKFDRIADKCSRVRGKIGKAIDDYHFSNLENGQSFTEKLVNSISHVLYSTEMNNTGASKSQQAIR